MHTHYTSHMDINVTKPFLPPFEEYIDLVHRIWDSKQLTNNGYFSQKLEKDLSDYLDVQNVTLFSNGTAALIASIKCLELKGEVITTPFSYVATVSSLLWNNLKPVFVDIEDQSMNLDPTKVVGSINANTSGILPVHCYGNPAKVEDFVTIQEKFGLKIVYDGAHAFGSKCHCGSLLSHGDLTAVSFHATKVYNTFEGGAVISHTCEHKTKLEQLRNFGYSSTQDSMVVTQGFNGKMTEMQAALGLLQLKYIDEVLNKRKSIAELYIGELACIPGIKAMVNIGLHESNYAYFPILITDNYPVNRDQLMLKFKAHGINVRKYFHPLIPSMNIIGWSEAKVKELLPVAYDMSSRILCLPIYPDIEHETLMKIVDILHY